MSEEITFKSFKLHTGIINAMVDSKLDPEEFFAFMQKYAPFIELGITVKKLDAVGSVEFDKANPSQLLSAGANCFGSLLEDFNKEWEKRVMEKKVEKKPARRQRK
ncbi:MAG: hypothetical protein DRP02_02370 [Candidatus Gerdarchaeota archaeon]|nr:MAG: hypothetical protein DRP02_02370 [Candidatus Gerdarchaeota archaeon]